MFVASLFMFQHSSQSTKRGTSLFIPDSTNLDFELKSLHRWWVVWRRRKTFTFKKEKWKHLIFLLEAIHFSEVVFWIRSPRCLFSYKILACKGKVNWKRKMNCVLWCEPNQHTYYSEDADNIHINRHIV